MKAIHPMRERRNGAGFVAVFAALLLLALVFGSGCAPRAELINVREGMDKSTATIREQHQDLMHRLAIRDDGTYATRDELPKLTQADVAAVDLAHSEYNRLVNNSRAKDGFNLFGGKATTQP